MLRRYWKIGLTLTLVSCSALSDRKQLARVGSSILYFDEIAPKIPNDLTPNDSAFFVQNYIRGWIKEEILYQEALKKLPDKEKERSAELQDYYRSLLKYSLEKKLAEGIAAPEISEEDINSYYEANKKNFELRRNIIRLLYVKLPKSEEVPVKKISEWVKEPSRENFDSLRKSGIKYAANYTLDTTRWFYFDDITKEIPLADAYTPSHFMRNNTFVSLEDSSYHYFVNIIDKRIKDDTAPLSMERQTIRNILKNRNQLDKLKSIEENLIHNAERENKIEIY